jgi:hypothetical protein
METDDEFSTWSNELAADNDMHVRPVGDTVIPFLDLLGVTPSKSEGNTVMNHMEVDSMVDSFDSTPYPNHAPIEIDELEKPHTVMVDLMPGEPMVDSFDSTPYPNHAPIEIDEPEKPHTVMVDLMPGEPMVDSFDSTPYPNHAPIEIDEPEKPHTVMEELMPSKPMVDSFDSTPYPNPPPIQIDDLEKPHTIMEELMPSKPMLEMSTHHAVHVPEMTESMINMTHMPIDSATLTIEFIVDEGESTYDHEISI